MTKTATQDEIRRVYQNFEDAFDINIPNASKANLVRLKSDLGVLSLQEQQLYDTLMRLPFTIRHGTSYGSLLRESGEILSVQERVRQGQTPKNSHTSADGNRDDSVFFVFGVNHHRVPLFLGNETEIVTAPVTDELLRETGIFVAPHLSDFMGNRNLGSMFFGDTKKKVSHIWNLDPETLEETREKTYTYIRPNGEVIHRKYGFGDEIFCGGDIVEGLTLKFIQELRDIGGDYQNAVLQHVNDHEWIGNAYNTHFQSWVYPEAQIPVRFDLGSGVEWAQSELHPNSEELHNAAKRGDLETIDRLLAEGVPIDTTFGEKNGTALLQAILKGQSKMALHLLDKGADPTKYDPGLLGDTRALPMAVLWCDHRVVHKILDKRVVADPNFPLAKYTLSEGLEEAIAMALRKERPQIIRRIINELGDDIDYKNSQLVSYAISFEANDWAEYFARKGADVNNPFREFLSEPYTPLMQLATKPPEKRSKSDIQLAKALIGLGAKVDEQYWRPTRSFAGKPGENFRTALFLAAENGNLPILKVLAEHGANWELPNDLHETPLHAAERNEHSDVIQYLKQRGAQSIPPKSTPLSNVGKAEFTCSGIVTGTNDRGERFVVMGRNRGKETLMGDYRFPGGGVDNDKDALTAVVREIYEETGINLRKLLSPEQLMGASMHHYEKVEFLDDPEASELRKRSLRDHKTFVFDIGSIIASIQPKARDDFVDVRLVSLTHGMSIDRGKPLPQRYSVDGQPVLGSNGLFAEHIASGQFKLSPEAAKDISAVLRQEYYGEQMLIDAFAANDVEKAKELLEAGISIDSKGTFIAKGLFLSKNLGRTMNIKRFHASPLVVAAYVGDLDVLNFVLSKNPVLETQNLGDHSALEAAILSNSPNKHLVVERLLNVGVHPDADVEVSQRYNQHNPLIEATRLKDKKAVKMLVDWGANVNFIDDDGNTPITEAIRTRDPEIVKTVLSRRPHLNYTWIDKWENETQYVSVFGVAHNEGGEEIKTLVANEHLNQRLEEKLGIHRNGFFLSVHPDGQKKLSVHVTFVNKADAERLSTLVNGALRRDETSGAHYVRLGEKRISDLFKDCRDGYGQAIYQAQTNMPKALSRPRLPKSLTPML